MSESAREPRATAAPAHGEAVNVAVTVPEALSRWAAARTGSAALDWTSARLTGGAIAGDVELLTARAADGTECRLVRKPAQPHEIYGLRAAQQVRAADGDVIPELVAAGVDTRGPWLATPYHPGTPLHGRAPDALFAALARVHAHFRDRPVERVPTVDPAWWRRLIEDWALPTVNSGEHRHPAALVDDVNGVLVGLVRHPAVPAALDGLPVTLLHGDVHPGNVLVDATGTEANGTGACTVRLIDWGSARRGPAALDLATIAAPDGPEVAAYRRAWTALTGEEPDEEELRRGFRWARLHIPVQYLPWVVGNRGADEVRAALAEIEHALDRLR